MRVPWVARRARRARVRTRGSPGGAFPWGHLASEEAVNIVARVHQQQISHGGKVWLDDLHLGEGAFRQQTLVDQAVLLHGEAMVGTNVNRVAGVVDNEHDGATPVKKRRSR